MNKTELIAAAAEKSGLSKKDTESALNAAIDVITAALTEGDKIQLVGFGSFEVKNRAARTGRNPKTKEPIEIPASKLPMFKPGRGDMQMRLDKWLKVSRLIKRRTVANEACDNQRVTANGRPVKASYDVKEGDVLELRFGERTVKVQVLTVAEHVGKADAPAMYREL